jgi:hypothetical protein
MPGRFRGAEPLVNAWTHASDDPSNVALITAPLDRVAHLSLLLRNLENGDQ